jgi:signal transduction histidine kinase
MKIFKSIKWRLQIWYGLILVIVLAGFGFTAYQLERGRLFGRIDIELHRRVGILANALHRPPPRALGGNEQPFDRPPPGQFPDDGPPGQNLRPPLEFHLPPEAAGLFDTNDPNSFYFAIVSFRADAKAKEIARSTNFPNPPFNISTATESARAINAFSQLPVKLTAPTVQTIGNYREIDSLLPSGEMIYVGCSIAPELKELRLTAIKLAGFGGIILFFGLAVGWWLVSRAIKPIENISAAAVRISAGDLSQRINVAEAESELGKLASVLNSTFARLDAAFAQQKQFASDAAHELRTPVSVILTQTQTALNRERTAPEYRETVEACQRAAQRMRKLIGALLELARLDAGQEQMKRLRFDFARTVADCVGLVRPLAEERGVKMFTELSPLEIAGDSERVAQVATNLLTNAVQYNQPNGEVRVKLASQGGLAILTVSDTGLGIPAEDLPHVFQRFYRGDKSRTGGNAGLGLAISKAIVEAHGGTIEASSEEDAGTIFTVRLPLA